MTSDVDVDALPDWFGSVAAIVLRTWGRTMSRKHVRATVYTSGQAAEAAGLAYHQLNNWAKIGFLGPSVVEADGTETCRGYSFADVVALSAARRLREFGLELEAIANAISYLQAREYGDERGQTVLVGTHDGGVIEGELEKVISTLQRSKRFSWMMDVCAVIADVRSALRKVKPPQRGKARRVGCLTGAVQAT